MPTHSLHAAEYRLPDAVLCLDGTLPPAAFFSELPALPLVAADGAALRLAERSVRASVVVGDFDTVDASGQYALIEGIPHYRLSSQESTDFEKCLDYCIQCGYSTVLVCGIHGGEMEHSLNNWSIAMRYARQLHLCLYDAGRYGLPINASVSLPVQPSETISLIPQPYAVLTTSGLNWPLSAEELRLGVREGARNRAVHDSVDIVLHEGSFLLFCRATPPLVPVFPL